MSKIQPVKLNNNGFSLVEVLVASVIVLLVFFALMQTALIAIESNMLNELRNEAIYIAQLRMNNVRDMTYTSIVSDSASLSSCDCPSGFYSSGECISRNVRSLSYNYCTNLSCTELSGDGNCATNDADNKQITITVGWKWKGNNYTHVISTIRNR
ncbi:MAG: prepilin-type N-terminal cleavage/methylation domain-containing protein [Nitrospirae bacterium]|nr:prepilin-type N-terminal cleavage/methylation domain-containing protein [Nitrospirota bacterium]